MVKGNLKDSDIYAPRRLRTLGKGYSIFVKTLKFVLPLAVLVILGVLISHLSVDPKKSQISDASKSEKTVPGQVEVLEARYESVDEKGQNYTITADKSTRTTDGEDGILFENPLADIILDNHSWLALKAKGGFFSREKEKLVLKDDVTIFHDSGYEMSLKDISIDLQKKTASTSEPVSIKGPMGTIKAQSMVVKDNAEIITFVGPVHMKIYNLASMRKHK